MALMPIVEAHCQHLALQVRQHRLDSRGTKLDAKRSSTLCDLIFNFHDISFLEKNSGKHFT